MTPNSIYPEDALVALASMRLKRPVKWRGSRTEDFLSGTQGRGAVIEGELAVDANGKFEILLASEKPL